MAKMKFPRGLKSVKVINVIETVAEVGYGTDEDPVREKTQYWSLDGKYLGESEKSSQNKQKVENKFPTIPSLFQRNKNVLDRKIELLHKIFDEKERRRALELVAEDKIKAGEYEEANKILKSIDDNIIKDLRQQLDELEKE